MQTFNEYKKEKDSTKDIKFFEARKAGARKIAQQSYAKHTDPAELTYWHFKAKDHEYDRVLSAIRSKRPVSYFKHEMRNFLSRLASANTQKEFQEVMGKLEVWGETYVYVKN